MAAGKAYQANPGDPNAVAQMQAATVLMNGIKRANPNIMAALTATDSVAQQKMDEVNSWVNPKGKVIVSPEAVGRMLDLAQKTHDQLATRLAPVTSLYQNQADSMDLPGSKFKTRDQIPWITATPQQQPNIPSSQQLDDTYQQAKQKSPDPAYQQSLNQWYQNKKSSYGYQ